MAHLKNISQNGNLPQIGMKIENIWNINQNLYNCLEPPIFQIPLVN